MIQDFISITVKLTNFCDFSCSYCDSSVNDGSHPRLMDIDSILNFVLFLKNITGKKIYVEMMGGEPTTSTIFRQLVNNLLFLDDVYVEIMSNGARSVKYWDTVSLNDRVFLTLSYHYEFCDVQHFVDLALYLKDKCNLHVALQVKNDNICFDKNIFILTQLKNTNIEIYLKLLRKSIVGSEYFTFSESQLSLIQEIKQVLREHRNFSNVKKLLGDFSLINGEKIKTSELQNLNFKGWYCAAGTDRFVIDSNGDIYRCSYRSGGKIANINYPQTFAALNFKPHLCHFDGKCICKTDVQVVKYHNTNYKR